MALFKKKNPYEQELLRLEKAEHNFLEKRLEKEDTFLNRLLAEKVPEKLQHTLDQAFAKAFGLIFEKGTGIIEKTYHKDAMKVDYQVRNYTAAVKPTKKSLRAFSKAARGAENKNLLLSGVSGIGMGVLGIGLPDIPVFTSLILRNLYEEALHYGYEYDTTGERYFILLLIQGAVSYGETLSACDQRLNDFIERQVIPADYDEKQQITETAAALSKELLYMNFLRGIPIVGAVGGAYNLLYMKQIAGYADLKYRRRYLLECQKRKLEGKR